jgi:hypothetical protein
MEYLINAANALYLFAALNAIQLLRPAFRDSTVRHGRDLTTRELPKKQRVGDAQARPWRNWTTVRLRLKPPASRQVPDSLAFDQSWHG